MTPNPDLKPDQIVRREDFAKITASLTKALASEFSTLNDDTKKKLLENVEDLLATAFALANGITIQKFETDRQTGKVDEVIYTVPPFWPVIKYFLDWFREIADNDTSGGPGLGLTDPDVKAFLRELIDERPDIQQGGVEDRGGVRHLVPFPITEEENDKSTTDD